MFYYAVKCNKCGTWTVTATKKKVRDVIHTCKVPSCAAKRKLWTQEAGGVRLYFKTYDHPVMAMEHCKICNIKDLESRQTIMGEFQTFNNSSQLAK